MPFFVQQVLNKRHKESRIEKKASGYQCFHCLQNAVIWDADFDFSDMGYDGEGVVHTCHCSNCGAEIEYRIGEQG